MEVEARTRRTTDPSPRAPIGPALPSRARRLAACCLLALVLGILVLPATTGDAPIAAGAQLVAPAAIWFPRSAPAPDFGACSVPLDAKAPGRTVDTQRGLPVTMEPLELQVGNRGGDSARVADQSAILEGRYPIAVPSGAGAKTAHASFLLKAGHAQRLGAGALREMLGEGRPDHVSEGLHSEFQHVWSSGLHTSVGFGRRQSKQREKARVRGRS